MKFYGLITIIYPSIDPSKRYILVNYIDTTVVVIYGIGYDSLDLKIELQNHLQYKT